MSKHREQLAKYCDRPGYSRSAASLKAGYNKNYASNVINGKITPTIEALEALSVALDVPLSWILFGEGQDDGMSEIMDKLRRIDPAGLKAVRALVDTLSSEDQ